MGEIGGAKITNDIQRVAEIVSRPPSKREYKEHGQYPESMIRSRFGGWVAALEAAGFDTSDLDRPWVKTTNVSDEELLDELRACAEHLGRTPTYREMQEHPVFTGRVYETRFGSWNKALKAAKLEVNKPGNECAAVSKSEFLADIIRADEELGNPWAITSNEYLKHGNYSYELYKKWDGEWADFLIEAGLIEPA